MRAIVKMFGEDGRKLAVPQELYRLRNWSSSSLARIMQMLGIDRITLDISDAGAYKDVGVAYSTFSEDVPDTLKSMRSSMVRAARELMPCMGLTEITITLEDEELDRLRTHWNYAKSGELSDYSPDDLEMPEILDPAELKEKLKKAAIDGIKGRKPDHIAEDEPIDGSGRGR